MLAFVGIFFGETLNILFDGKITGPAIYQFQQADEIFPAFWAAILFLIALVEGRTIIEAYQPIQSTLQSSTGYAYLDRSYEPGALGFDPLGLAPKNEAALKNLKTKELSNGRLAMLAVLGIVLQELKTGEKIF